MPSAMGCAPAVRAMRPLRRSTRAPSRTTPSSTGSGAAFRLMSARSARTVICSSSPPMENSSTTSRKQAPARGPRRPSADDRPPSAKHLVSLNLSDLLEALGLLLVLEGIAPFLHPQAVKRAFARLLTLRDRELRYAGLGSMLVGVILLFLVR